MDNHYDSNTAAHTDGFVALAVAEDAAVATAEVMQGVPASLRCFQDQAVRASASVALNVAEGSGRRGRERKRFYQVAGRRSRPDGCATCTPGGASAREAKSALRIAVRLNAVDYERGQEALALLDRAAALTWRLWTGAG